MEKKFDTALMGEFSVRELHRHYAANRPNLRVYVKHKIISVGQDLSVTLIKRYVIS